MPDRLRFGSVDLVPDYVGDAAGSVADGISSAAGPVKDGVVAAGVAVGGPMVEVAHQATKVVGSVVYARSYFANRLSTGINSVASHLGTLGRFVGHVVNLPLAGVQYLSLAGDVSIDWFKNKAFGPESTRDEGGTVGKMV